MWQKPINAIAVTWVGFISVVLMFPTLRPVTKENMNYAVAVAAGIAVFSLSWWWGGARKTYVGPRTREILERIEEGQDEEAS